MMTAKNFSIRFSEGNLHRLEQRRSHLRVNRSTYLEVCHDMVDRYFTDAQLEAEIRIFEMDRRNGK